MSNMTEILWEGLVPGLAFRDGEVLRVYENGVRCGARNSEYDYAALYTETGRLTAYLAVELRDLQAAAGAVADAANGYPSAEAWRTIQGAIRRMAELLPGSDKSFGPAVPPLAEKPALGARDPSAFSSRQPAGAGQGTRRVGSRNSSTLGGARQP